MTLASERADSRESAVTLRLSAHAISQFARDSVPYTVQCRVLVRILVSVHTTHYIQIQLVGGENACVQHLARFALPTHVAMAAGGGGALVTMLVQSSAVLPRLRLHAAAPTCAPRANVLR